MTSLCRCYVFKIRINHMLTVNKSIFITGAGIGAESARIYDRLFF